MTSSKIIFCAILMVVLAFGQSAPSHKTAKAAPKITAAFSKAAIKYLFTIGRHADKNLVDAASVDLDSAASTATDKDVAGSIDIFAAIYSAQEGADQARRDAAAAFGDAATGSPTSNQGNTCIGAWVPLLRTLSAETPKVCKTFMGQKT
jgi:hypothetical protein